MHHFATKARRTAGLLHSVDVTFVLGNRIAFAYTPSCPYPLIRGFWPVVAAGALHVFCAIRPVGAIRPLLDLPYCGNRSTEKQKSHHFCNFFAIRDSFLLP